MTNREFIEQHRPVDKKIKVLTTLGICTTEVGSRELNFWDKRRWITLTDFWLDRITKEHSDELLEQIAKEEREYHER